MQQKNKTKQKNEIGFFSKESKRCFGILLALSFYAVSALAQTPRTCKEILNLNPTAPSGVYTIDPDGTGSLPSMKCYCDMITDGGGWMLVLNYNKLVGTEPSLKIFTDSLPLQNNITPGFDESNTIYWGHAGNSLMNAIQFDEIRFYGITSNHNRVVNFKTKNPGTISYFKTGLGSAAGIKSQFTPLNGHTAYLPAAMDQAAPNQGNYAMTLATFYKNGNYHWDVGYPYSCGTTLKRWEVDDYPCYSTSTFHQIWVRGINTNPCSNITCNINPQVYYTDVTNASCNDGTINVKLGSGYNYYPHIELYNAGNNLIDSVSVAKGTKNYKFTNLSTGQFTVKVFDKTCCETTFVRLIKCASPASGFSTTNITGTTATLNWDVTPCAVGYRVQYRLPGTTLLSTTKLNTNTGFVNIVGLQPLTDYEWHVSTYCAGTEKYVYLGSSPMQTFKTVALRMGEVAQSVSSPESFEINIKPNPASTSITINFQADNSTANMKVLNTIGQIVFEKQLSGVDGIYEEKLDVSNFNNGIYFLLVENENGVSRRKFAKE